MRAIQEEDCVFNCLNYPRRRAMLRLIAANDELNVTELCERLGVRQQAVSHHLTIFKLRGIVQLCRRGQRNFYRLTDRGHMAVRLLEFAGA